MCVCACVCVCVHACVCACMCVCVCVVNRGRCKICSHLIMLKEVEMLHAFCQEEVFTLYRVGDSTPVVGECVGIGVERRHTLSL